MKKSIWSFAQVILLGVPLIACGVSVGPTRVQVPLNLTIAPTSLNLGSATVGTTSAAQLVTLTNNSSSSITVSAVSFSGPFASIAITMPATLNAGQSLALHVTFRPTAPGPATGTLTITSSAINSPANISLTGVGASPSSSPSGSPLITVVPTSLNLGSAAVGMTSSAQMVKVTNESSASITISAITTSGPFASAGVALPLILNFTQSLTLNLTFTPTASGMATGALTIASTAANSPSTVTLAGTGTSSSSQSPSGPIMINGQDGTVIEGLKITSSTGDCVQIINSTNITLQNSEIGPCAGNAVRISGGDGIHIFDSYIHPETLSPGCCDHNDGIFAVGTSNLLIQGNVIAYSESTIELHGSSAVEVKGNFLLNPRGPFPRGQNFQCWNSCSNVTVEDNYALSSTDTSKYLFPENQEDSINFGLTDGITVRNNYITGGHSTSGCGLIADKAANSAQFLGNIIVDTGQCGIGIADGTNQLVDGNKVINRNPVVGGGNQGIYVRQSHGSSGMCGPVTVSNNISVEYKLDGSLSGFWKGSGCDPLTLTNNVFGPSAVPLLTPVDQVLPPPSIPPDPKNCVVTSPYSTQVGRSLCIP